ncbi:outer membrane beta-barrel protein [Chitinophaga rhizophila]|uniref:Porin family protein n=1 Tax=Chitinophaga rhizophila TaxID=2866212 RepID=A0ABS7GC83_9BACT|nr:outer membrane beta-barrel protein [Chitinophaga rhizophila]MBW8684302.1 porin family protein [Chitinophaga rhizophila]
MKTIRLLTLALTALFFGSTVSAQTQKGNLMVGSEITDFGFNFQKESTIFHFDLSPKLAYFVQDDLALGAYVRLGLQTTGGNGTNVNYGVGALARYYFRDENVRKLEFSKRVRFFGEANAGFGGSNPANGASTNGIELGVGPGLSYFITPNVALDALVKYNVIIGGGNSTTSHNLNFGLGFQIFLPTARARAIMREEMNK